MTCHKYDIFNTTSRAEARPVPCPFYLKPVQYYPTFYLITTEGIQSNSNMTQMAIWYNVQILGLWELRVKLPFDSIQIGLLERSIPIHSIPFLHSIPPFHSSIFAVSIVPWQGTKNRELALYIYWHIDMKRYITI